MRIPQGTQAIVDKLTRISLYLTVRRKRLERPDNQDFQEWSDITDAIEVVESMRRAIEAPFKGAGTRNKPISTFCCR